MKIFKEIEQILSLTPYSGECYVKGSLQGKGIKVQRARVRECLKRLDGLGWEVRRRYALVRWTYNVPGSNYLWNIVFNRTRDS